MASRPRRRRDGQQHLITRSKLEAFISGTGSGSKRQEVEGRDRKWREETGSGSRGQEVEAGDRK